MGKNPAEIEYAPAAFPVVYKCDFEILGTGPMLLGVTIIQTVVYARQLKGMYALLSLDISILSLTSLGIEAEEDRGSVISCVILLLHLPGILLT